MSQNPISSEIEKAMDLIGKSLKSNMSSSVRRVLPHHPLVEMLQFAG